MKISIVILFYRDVGNEAYKHAISEAGKDQTKMTEGWKVLGLDKETAERIFNERKEKGFMTFREEMVDVERRRIADEIAEREAAAERLRKMFDEDGNIAENDDEEEEGDDDEDEE